MSEKEKEVVIDLEAENKRARLERKRKLNDKVQALAILAIFILFGIIWMIRY